VLLRPQPLCERLETLTAAGDDDQVILIAGQALGKRQTDAR